MTRRPPEELAEFRRAVRDGEWTGPTSGIAPGYVQANLVAVPERDAEQFALFCRRNPRACPVIEVLDPGSPVPRRSAPEVDVRRDLPRYRVYRRGELVSEPSTVTSDWREDLVTFLIGCSFTVEPILIAAGIGLRHQEARSNVAMFRTSTRCAPAGQFAGPLVVSMRPVRAENVERAAALTSGFPLSHGAPVHVGDPSEIGIDDVMRPDYGSAVAIEPGEVPVFWACGVTGLAAGVAAGVETMVTHAPGCMLVTSLRLDVTPAATPPRR